MKAYFAQSITGQTRQEILNLAEQSAGKLIEGITQSTIEGIAEVVKTGLKQQWGIEKTGRYIKEQIGLNKQRVQSVNKYRDELTKSGQYSEKQIDNLVKKFTNKQLSERANLIANTEFAKAMSEGEFEIAKQRGAKYKIWQTTMDEKVTDGCQSNQGEGPIPIDKQFSSGDMVPPRFPGCRCSVSYITNEAMLDNAKKDSEQRDKKTSESKGR
jgi:SPP1 gp7 family putative phage head morphogenesis protein